MHVRPLFLAIAASVPFVPMTGHAVTAAADLDEIVVTGTRLPVTLADSISPTEVIDRAEIERTQPLDLPELLQGRAGINLVNNGGPGKQTSLFMRGAGSNQILVLVDGIRIGSATAGLPALQDIPVEQIERIEIVRGPHSSLYGADAIGGVIQIFTRRDRGALRPRLHLGAGSDNLRRAGAGIGGGSERAWFGADVAYTRTDGINSCRGRGPDPADPYDFGAGCFTDEPDDDGYRNLSTSVLGGVALAEHWTLDAHLLRAEGENEYDGSWANYSEVVQQVAGATLDYAPASGFGLRSSVGRSTDRTDDYADGIHVAELRTRRDQATVQANLPLGTTQTAAVGIDWLRDRIDGTSGYDVASRDNLGVFAVWTGRFGAHHIEASARHDDNEQFGGHATGSLGWGLSLAHDLRLNASFSTGFRAPSFNDLYYPGFGNAGLQPEESKNLNLGVSQARNAWHWALDVYENRVDDLISYDAALGLPGNVAKARLRGAELAGGLALGEWRLGAQLSHVDPRNRSDGPGHDNLLARRARNTGRVDIDRAFGALRVGATVNAAGHRYDDAANLDRVGGFATTDLRVEYAFAPAWALQARVSNVFDRDYETVRWYNQPGRGFMVTLRYAPVR
ncbi:TonB-dependent receptor [Luteimonas sp. YGD11-2]|uniref:TonB-dependent receptor domain-containing protein n=1 Tax=Luteimonas sp. YGD11-2 TaxID=2508168 RepID=UPI00100B1FF6|nr:TonB-dependent receptor [Luteimonas sp. YGD11-2]